MIIDFHCHIFPDQLAASAIAKLENCGIKSQGNGTARGLIDAMDQAGIGQAVLLPIATKASQVEIINQNASLMLQSLYAKRLVPFGTLYPKDLSILEDQIDFLVRAGIKGVKLHPEYQDFFIDAPEYYPMFCALAEARLVVLIHAGKDPGPFSSDHALPVAIKNLLRSIPGLQLVAAHGGGWQVWNAVEDDLAGAQLYFDTSALMGQITPEQFQRLVRKHGSDRILFASDWPWYNLADSVRWVESQGFSSAHMDQILFANAQNLLA